MGGGGGEGGERGEGEGGEGEGEGEERGDMMNCGPENLRCCAGWGEHNLQLGSLLSCTAAAVVCCCCGR